MKDPTLHKPVLAAVLATGLIALAIAGYTAATGHASGLATPALSYMSVPF